MPENEDLTMRLAEAAGIEVPAHGLVRGRDGTWTYFTRRFDRLPRGRKDLLDYFAIERLGLTWAVVNRVVKMLDSARSRWQRWIEVSFLPEALKGAYLELMSERLERLIG